MLSIAHTGLRLPLGRSLATIASDSSSSLSAARKHKILVVGSGTAGVTAAAQLLRAFKSEKRPLSENEIAIIDPAERHHYQPGWTLAGTGLASLADQSKPLTSVIPKGVKLYPTAVTTFSPETNSISTSDGTTLLYDYLVVAPGLKTDLDKIPGLIESLKDSNSGVTSIYYQPTVEQTWTNLKNFQGGNAIFTQPAGIIKCAGAPQKVLWMALSQWKRDNKREKVKPTFATGGPAMFAVKKYADALEKLRKERQVEGLFNHNLTKIDSKAKIATFTTADGKQVEKSYDLLHVTPPQSPLDFIKNSPLADSAGWVSVDSATTQHSKFENIFSIGDASSLPNSKTAAAITSQVPVLVDNLRAHMDGKPLPAKYDGYASCPLLTGHDELMLCEFKYGGIPKETFAPILGSQDKPSILYYYLKKNVFPFAYWNSFVKGTWFGPRGPFNRPMKYMQQA